MQDGVAHQVNEFREDIVTVAFCRIEHGGERGISLSAPLRAETTHDLAMNDRGPQGTFACIVGGRHVGPMQKYQQVITMGAVSVQQLARFRASDAARQQPVQAFLQAGDLSLKAPAGQLVTPIPQVDRGPEEVLQLVRPAQVRTVIDQPLQVTNLVRQTQLAGLGGGLQLGFPTITAPHLGPSLLHEGLNHLEAATGDDQMILARVALKHPFPPVAAIHAGAGFIAADDGAMPDLRANRFGFGLGRDPRTLQDRHRPAGAQVNAPDILQNTLQTLKTHRLFMMQVRHQRFQPWPKLACGLQPGGQEALLLVVATRTHNGRLTRFNDHRLNLRQFDDLSPNRAGQRRVPLARFPAQRRDALLDRAAFYLMWHGGLRLGEVEELRLADLDLPNRKLMVRQGKGQKDRAVCLTDSAVHAVQEYLAVRGEGADDHVLLYRHRAVCKDLLHCRIKAAGERVGVKVTPHQLRHTFGTQLLNAGCKVTSIQQLLGHRSIDSTLIYARVHDETVASDYYAAMARIEKSLEIPAKTHGIHKPNTADPWARTQLLAMIDQLSAPQLGVETRLDLVTQMRHLLNGRTSHPALATVC